MSCFLLLVLQFCLSKIVSCICLYMKRKCFMTCLARNELLIFWYFLLLKLLVCLTYNYKIKIHISPNCSLLLSFVCTYSVAKMNYILTTYGFVQIKQHLIKIAKVCLTDQIWYTVYRTGDNITRSWLETTLEY